MRTLASSSSLRCSLGLDAAGRVWLIIVLEVGNALLGMALGLFLSAFAQTEFEAVQFMPAFVIPQILLAGLLVPRVRMARAARRGPDRGLHLLALALGATTLRRRTA